MSARLVALAIGVAVAVAERVHAERGHRVTLRGWRVAARTLDAEVDAFRETVDDLEARRDREQARLQARVEVVERAAATTRESLVYKAQQVDRLRSTLAHVRRSAGQTEDALAERLRKAVADHRDALRERDVALEQVQVVALESQELRQRLDDAIATKAETRPVREGLRS